MRITNKMLEEELNNLPQNYKTRHLDEIIKRYIKEDADLSGMEKYLERMNPDAYRIFFYVSLNKIKDVNERAKFINDRSYLFHEWYHTDQVIKYVRDLDLQVALNYAKEDVKSQLPFVRRWGYVMFISKLGRTHAKEILPLLHSDDEYYVQMAEAWLLAELTIDDPEDVYNFLESKVVDYRISGKAIQKITESFRINDEWKNKFRELRKELK